MQPMWTTTCPRKMVENSVMVRPGNRPFREDNAQTRARGLVLWLSSNGHYFANRNRARRAPPNGGALNMSLRATSITCHTEIDPFQNL